MSLTFGGGALIFSAEKMSLYSNVTVTALKSAISLPKGRNSPTLRGDMPIQIRVISSTRACLVLVASLLVVATFVLVGCTQGENGVNATETARDEVGTHSVKPHLVPNTPVATTPPIPKPPPTVAVAPLEGVSSGGVEPTTTAAAEVETTSLNITIGTQQICLEQRQQIAQLLMPLVTETEIAATKDIVAQEGMAGITLLGTPGPNLANELAALKAQHELGLLVASDEEGGPVQRLGNILGELPSAMWWVENSTPEALEERLGQYAASAKELGVDIIFAPVADLGSGPGIGRRSFGTNPDEVTGWVQAQSRAISENGVIAVWKHFPGHGSAEVDTHLGLATTVPLSQLIASDLQVYENLPTTADPNSAPVAVMVGHLVVSNLTEGQPASLSAAAVDGLLREEYGFEGLVFSDAMNMGAIVNHYGLPTAAELSLRAGVDIVIIGGITDFTPILDHLEHVAANDQDLTRNIHQHFKRVAKAKNIRVNGSC